MKGWSGLSPCSAQGLWDMEDVPPGPHTQPLPLSQDCQSSEMGGTGTPWDLGGCQALAGITEKGEAIEQSPSRLPKPSLRIH